MMHDMMIDGMVRGKVCRLANVNKDINKTCCQDDSSSCPAESLKNTLGFGLASADVATRRWG